MRRTKQFCTLLLAGTILATSVTPMTVRAASWKQNSVGWWYQEDNGSYPANQWKAINGNWYWFDGNGYMVTGWKNIGGNWYYFQASGAMLGEGWHAINGKWYYMYANGVMATSTWIGDDYVNSSGVWIYHKGNEIDVKNYLNDYKSLKPILQMKPTKYWQFWGNNDSYVVNGFYLEWDDSVYPIFSMKNEGNPNVQLYGIHIGDKVTEAGTILRKNGWKDLGQGTYIAIINNGQYLIEIKSDKNGKVKNWYMNNWPEGEDLIEAFESLRK